MTAHQEKEIVNISIVEAVETLSRIAELEVNSSIAIAENHQLDIQNTPIVYRTVHWLHRKNAEKTMRIVRETFHVILHYLKKFYQREQGRLLGKNSVEGIKTIMLLVGEAAKKVDKYTRIFVGKQAESVKNSREFKQLQSFYRHKIAPVVIQEGLAQWIRTLPIKTILDASHKKRADALGYDVQRVFIDLDAVKKDSEYELFFIRKENGSRFFSPRLLKNMQLVCNFEDQLTEKLDESFAQELKQWKDKQAYLAARDLIRTGYHAIDDFFNASVSNKSQELVLLLNKAIMALMLASYSSLIGKTYPAKTNQNYFQDFQSFLRELLSSREFHKLLTYPPRKENRVQIHLLECVKALCSQIFLGMHINKEAINLVNKWAQHSLLNGVGISEKKIEQVDSKLLSTRIEKTYILLAVSLKPYAHIPLNVLLEMIQEQGLKDFDPLMHQNLPGVLFHWVFDKAKIQVIKLPCPVTQGFITKASVAEEFKCFLRACSAGAFQAHYLLLNLQDRTSWKEHARCMAIEELQKKREFSPIVTVITLSKETDFYHQMSPYREINQADLFIEQLLEHAESASSGFYYPESVVQKVFSGFSVKLAEAIHAVFFGSKNMLTHRERMDFIELFYMFIQLKLIEIVKPTWLSVTCKDGLDVSMTALAEIFTMLKLIHRKEWSLQEEEYIKTILFAETFIHRGRLIFEERFNRFMSVIRFVEDQVADTQYSFFKERFENKLVPLFESSILLSSMTIP